MLSTPRAMPSLSYCINDTELQPKIYDVDGIEKNHHCYGGGYDIRTNAIRHYLYIDLAEIGLMKKYKLIQESEESLISALIDKFGETNLHELIHWGAEVYHGFGFEPVDFAAVTAACGFNSGKAVCDFLNEQPKHKPLVIFE